MTQPRFFDCRGQAALEAALIIPVLLFLLMGMFVVGYWLNALQVVTAAAREGARVGALTGDRCQATSAVTAMMQVITAKGVTIEIPNPLPALGSPLTVKVTYQIPFGFDYFKSEYEQRTSSTYPFSKAISQAVARMEVDPAGGGGC